MKIQEVHAYQVYDSRGNPTVEAEVTLANGKKGRGMTPSGASTGRFEALEMRDNDSARFGGKSVFRAIGNVHKEIAPAVAGMDVLDQSAIDMRMIELDGTPTKSRLGANAVLAVSMAVANAAAVTQELPLFRSLADGRGNLLPLPEIQIVGGGAHACWRTDVQDFLVIAIGAKSFNEVMEMTFNIHRAAQAMMAKRGAVCGVAEEGGLWPDFPTNESVLQFLVEAIEAAGYAPGVDAAISLDIAASDLFDEEMGTYKFRLEQKSFAREEFAGFLIDWCDRYPIVSMEDPMGETDWEGWSIVAAKLRDRVQLIGDDLFTTNLERIKVGVEKNVANSVLIKLNQIGTVTETIEAIRYVQEVGWSPVVSARSGETEDGFISHLAVATNAGQLKVGSFTRGERMAKWNEVLRIERLLGDEARFAGSKMLPKVVYR